MLAGVGVRVRRYGVVEIRRRACRPADFRDRLVGQGPLLPQLAADRPVTAEDPAGSAGAPQIGEEGNARTNSRLST
jgi:hypothetical protein